MWRWYTTRLSSLSYCMVLNGKRDILGGGNERKNPICSSVCKDWIFNTKSKDPTLSMVTVHFNETCVHLVSPSWIWFLSSINLDAEKNDAKNAKSTNPQKSKKLSLITYSLMLQWCGLPMTLITAFRTSNSMNQKTLEKKILWCF